MAVLVGNEPYTRFVFDPEEGETKFKVSNGAEEKLVSVEELEDALTDDGWEVTRMIVVPKEGARKINVTYRPLRSVHKHAVQDLAAETGIVGPGASRRLLIKQAVIKWDYDVAWSEAILDQLDSGLEEQIYAWISWGNFPPEQDQDTGQPVPLEEEVSEEITPKRPAKKKAASISQKTTDTSDSAEASEDV